jgi:hypothetical protein
MRYLNKTVPIIGLLFCLLVFPQSSFRTLNPKADSGVNPVNVVSLNLDQLLFFYILVKPETIPEDIPVTSSASHNKIIAGVVTPIEILGGAGLVYFMTRGGSSVVSKGAYIRLSNIDVYSKSHID